MLLKNYYAKFREMILYIFFGVWTVVISIITFYFFDIYMGIDVLVANVLSWLIAVLFAFITNKRWVFCSNVDTLSGLSREMLKFFLSRFSTLVLEEAIIWLFVVYLCQNSLAVKFSAQVMVIISNYVLSKKIVFK